MDKKEKFEAVTMMVKALGLRFDEVVAYWQQTGEFSVRGLSVKIPKMMSKTKGIEVGMYVYEDNSIHSEIIEGRRIKAVVGYVEDNTVYAVCLRQAQMQWSSRLLVVKDTRNMCSGKEATQKILVAAEISGKPAEAAQWCHEYDYNGVKKGEAFLPSFGELKKLYKGKVAINDALKVLRAELLEGWIWSSSEKSNSSAWNQAFDEGYVYDNYHKYNHEYVRPVLALTY